ncbi:CAP domain-containing protein [Micromonospora sp. WMMD708]|uniref:CAP domain-containing protein n=1 Tax=Micromonospora sp. WMMD708 TaxID=3403464 RepID=UPI003BF547D7
MPLFRGRRSVTPARKRPVEATGVYGWTDPNDPDAAYRRPQPSADDPTWLTDRPAPRSAYLFGDDPAVDAAAQPGTAGADAATGPAGGTPPPAADRWADAPAGQDPTGPWQGEQTGWQDAPTGRWHAGPAGHWDAAGQTAAHQEDAWQADAWQAERWSDGRNEPAGTWQGDPAGTWQEDPARAWQGEPAGAWQEDRTGPWPDEQDDRAGAWQGARDDRDDRWPDEQAASRPDGQPHTWPAGHGEPDHPWQGGRDDPWQGGQDDRAGAWQGQPAAGPARADQRDATVATPTVGPVDVVAATGRTRRSRRPLLIGGAAAAATLVVSLGIGAVLLPDDDGNTDRTALDEPVATAPVISDTAPASSAPASPSASPSPSPTSASPSPSRTATPTPTPSRTKAASRQTARSGSGTVAPTAPPTTRAAVSGGGGGSQTQQVVDLVNAERAKAGCAAVTVDAKLTLAAQQHSQDQADHKTMTHTGSDGSNAGQRLDRAGYAWRTYGENVAWNQQTPAAVMQAWMNSSGHRANILNCAFTQIGVGVANGNGPYWTQDFAAPR